MYPPQVYADPVAWARHMDEPYWGALMGDNPTGTTIQGWVTVEQLITDMDAACIAFSSIRAIVGGSSSSGITGRS